MHSMGEMLVISVGWMDLEYNTDGHGRVCSTWSRDRQADHMDGVGRTRGRVADKGESSS